MKIKAGLGTLGVITLALVTVACEDTGRAKEESREAAGAAADAANRAADRAGEVAGQAGDAIGAAKQTFDVKAALTLDTTIDASHIDVDTSHETRTVTLRGTVPTAAQKDAAERIARDKAEGYTISNQLTVAVQ
ncbi:MAG TPA: BON domain-containing protein [Vicinamibacteria bacterium]|nr:BON domain-containing protein [Vicinamibacteria bacterium]